METVRRLAQTGDFVILPHAIERGIERGISVADVTYALINGRHESSKDSFKVSFGSWNYAVRGKTIDKHELRIAIAFDENHMLIITVIQLAKGRR